MNYISPIQAGAGCKHEMLPLSRCSCEQAHDHPSTPQGSWRPGRAGALPRGPLPPRGARESPRGATARCARPCPREKSRGRCPGRLRPESAGAACGEGGLGPLGAQSRHRRASRAGELSSPPVALRQQPLSPRSELLMRDDGGFFNSETQQSRTFPRQDPPAGKFDI